MNKQDIVQALASAKQTSPKRNFKQSVDLIINLKDIDLKKTENQVNNFVTLHYPTGKKVSVCALVSPGMDKAAQGAVDEVIVQENFAKFKGKADIKKLADKHDFFIAEATVMPKIATAFGKVFGPRGKMPNPKVGSVFPAGANIAPINEKLQKTIKVATVNNEPCIKCLVGKEDLKQEELIDNIETAYNAVLHMLPNEEHNIKNVMLKLTMGPSVTVGGKEEAAETPKEEKEEAKEEVKEEPKAEAPAQAEEEAQ